MRVLVIKFQYVPRIVNGLINRHTFIAEIVLIDFTPNLKFKFNEKSHFVFYLFNILPISPKYHLILADLLALTSK